MTQEPDRTSGQFDLPGPLPVWGTVVDSYRTVFIERRGHLLRALFVPLVLSLLLSLLTLHATDFGAIRPEGLAAVGAALFWRAAFAVPLVIFAVSWHRLMLFGPEEGKPPLWPGLGTRHLSYFGYVVLAAVIFVFFNEIIAKLGIGAIAKSLPPGLEVQVGGLVGLLCSLAAAYVVVRICFVYPATAADRAYPLLDAWTDARDLQWPLLGAVFLTTLPYGLFRILFYIASDGHRLLSMPGTESATSWEALAAVVMANEAVMALATFVTVALGASLISRVFMRCVGWEAPSTKAAPQTEPNPATVEQDRA